MVVFQHLCMANLSLIASSHFLLNAHLFIHFCIVILKCHLRFIIPMNKSSNLNVFFYLVMGTLGDSFIAALTLTLTLNAALYGIFNGLVFLCIFPLYFSCANHTTVFVTIHCTGDRISFQNWTYTFNKFDTLQLFFNAFSFVFFYVNMLHAPHQWCHFGLHASDRPFIT